MGRSGTVARRNFGTRGKFTCSNAKRRHANGCNQLERPVRIIDNRHWFRNGRINLTAMQAAVFHDSRIRYAPWTRSKRDRRIHACKRCTTVRRQHPWRGDLCHFAIANGERFGTRLRKLQSRSRINHLLTSYLLRTSQFFTNCSRFDVDSRCVAAYGDVAWPWTWQRQARRLAFAKERKQAHAIAIKAVTSCHEHA